MNEKGIRRALFAAFFAVLLNLFSAPARAQAWLPPKGEASLAVGYGDIFVNRHYLGTSANPGDNVENDFGHIRSQSFQIALGYGLSDRLAVSVALPYILTKYYGTPDQNFFPHTISVDDGHYHGIFQDFRVDLDYQLLRGPIAVAPFVAAVIPSHSYTYFAHSAAGKALHEYLLGSSFGARLDKLLAGSYVELTYSYAFVERVLGIHHDRSNGFLELGYFLTPSLSVRGIGTGVYTHGGIVGKAADQPPPPEIFLHHDQIGHESGISVGGGLSYVLTGSTEVYASYLTQVQGRGGHKIKDSLSFGVTYNFSPSQLVRRFFPATSGRTPAERP
ncbi:MAG TPA: hypothetical protein VEO02_00535 [Thermoanaerobaculia bacterium]|nr:hypothetical protein [Thermoanaerobaculia bacterium]